MMDEIIVSPNQPLAFWLVLGGFGQGTLLSVALFNSKKGYRPSNIWLGASVLLISVCSLLSVLATRTANQELEFPWLYQVPVPMNFLFGPFLYFYVLSVFRLYPPARIKPWVHFAPFLLCAVFLVPTFLLSPEQKMALVSEVSNPPAADSSVMTLIFALQSLSLISYSVASTMTYFRSSKAIYQNYSTIKESHLQLLRFLLVSSLTLIATGILTRLLRAPVPEWLVPSGGALLVLVMGYRGYFVPDLFAGIGPEASSSINSVPTPKYRKTGLKSDQIDKLKAQLVEMMEKRRIYQDSTLSLQALAKEMRMTPNHLSQLINEHFEQRFFDFVNHYRVKEAKGRLDQEECPPNMLELGFQVGFNSKSTFYSAFKRAEGCTPLEYHQTRHSTR